MVARVGIVCIVVVGLVAQLQGVVLATHGNADVVFERTWQRPDLPVASGQAQRTWIWGPGPVTDVLHEPYEESTGGERSVQYYDKARMEVTFADGDQESIWYVTNGLLVIELMTGAMQVGDNAFVTRSSAQVNVAGDAGDPNGPTYATMATVTELPAAAPGAGLVQRIDRSGTVSVDANLATYGVQASVVTAETGHAVAGPFWDFMNSTGTVYVDGAFVADVLFQNPYFATGFPVTEAYWADVQVGGVTKLLLLQCFQRRCLTYTPDNAPQWQVEAGNVGLHYRAWRYDDGAPPPPPPGSACEPGSGPNFAGQLLLQPSYVDEDLRCAVFTNADVAQGNFTRANARLANFDDALLRQPEFVNTDLDGASFVGAELEQPEFNGTVATNVDFSGASFSQPSFVNANLLGAQMATASFVMPTFVNTICPDGSNSDSSGGTCLGRLDDPGDPPGGACSPGDGPDFSGQVLMQPVFSGQGLVCADFSDATVAQGDFTAVNAGMADFTRADLAQPDFTNTILDGALFHDTSLAQPGFTRTSLVGADFSGATLAQPLFSGANLLGAELRSATLVMPSFVDTICPDGTNSDDNGGSCADHLVPAT